MRIVRSEEIDSGSKSLSSFSFFSPLVDLRMCVRGAESCWSVMLHQDREHCIEEQLEAEHNLIVQLAVTHVE